MKILFLVAHLNSGGSERTVTYLSSSFCKQNISVDVVSITNEFFYSLDPRVNLIKLGIPGFSNSLFERCYYACKRYICVNKAIKKEKPDVVICILPGMAKYILKLHRHKKFILISSERNNPEIASNFRRVLKIFDQCDGIVFQTRRAMAFYPERIQNKSIIIENAIGNEYVYNCPIVSKRRNKITAIGRLTSQKNYPLLFKAFRRILDEYPDYRLEIFGDGPDKRVLADMARALNITDSVSFMGACSDAIIQASDSKCYVLSSLYEGMPNALMEAMAVGLPCIATDCPNGPAELIQNGINGLLVENDNVDSLVSAIKRFIEDEEFAEKCGINARRVLESHSVERYTKSFSSFIQRLREERSK